MGVKLFREKCNGCGSCVAICPGDLMTLDAEGKSRIRNQADCWDCMACVKACPRGALQTRLAFSLADFGASLIPELGPDQIRWTSRDADGNVEEFTVPRQ